MDVPDVIADRYELDRLIGAGGNGRVFAARDRVLDRWVAVKLVDAEAVRHRDPAGRERFLDEARSSAGFIHPNAVAVFDAGEADGSLFLVMELVEGETLADRLAFGRRLEPTVAVKVATDLLAALEAAHGAGIVHRDVKPANVLLDAAGTAKLADFGIAKRLDSVAAGLTNPGQFFGTPKYLAPEQVDGRPVTAATDVYAVGVVLFEMLAGRAPFDLVQPMATAIAQRDAPVPDLLEIRPDLPPTLVEIVGRALRKEPAERFESAVAMRAALGAPLWPAPLSAATPAGLPVAAPVDATSVMAARDVATTAMLPAPNASPTGTQFRPGSAIVADRRRPPVRVPAVVLSLLAVGALIAALAVRDSSSAPPIAAATTLLPGETAVETVAASAPVETPVAPTAVADTTPLVATPPLPFDVPSLVAFLVIDPTTVGQRGPDVLDRLRKIEDRKGKKQRGAAQDLRDEIGKWVDDGELTPEFGSLTTQILDRTLGTAEDD